MSGFDAPDIEALIQQGNGFAAQLLGVTTQVYRPTGSSNPLSGPPVTTILASFNTSAKFDAVKPSDYPKPLVYGLFDRTATLPGDYLVTGSETHFIASQDLNQSTLCVQCNATLAFERAVGTSGTSQANTAVYGGRTDATDTALLTGWPASLLIKTRGEAGLPAIPGQPKQALFEVLLPNTVGIALQIGDLVRDGTGNAYVLSAVETSALGYRLYAQTTDA